MKEQRVVLLWRPGGSPLAFEAFGIQDLPSVTSLGNIVNLPSYCVHWETHDS